MQGTCALAEGFKVFGILRMRRSAGRTKALDLVCWTAHCAGLQGSSFNLEINGITGIMGGFFGSGATRSRAGVTEVTVRACRGGGMAWIVDGWECG